MNEALILTLYDIEIIKFGSFTLKSGITSPIYLDLRQVISYPSLLKEISNALWEKVKNLSFDLLCGVPYTALPIASYLSITRDIPMLLKRKEAKTYGTKKLIEGVFSPSERCLIIEDVISSGASVLETVEPLKETGLIVSDVAVIIDRNQGGVQRLTQAGLNVHSLLSLTEILEVLLKHHKISQEVYLQTEDFLHGQITL
jgi:uridine monophosphate synthetase